MADLYVINTRKENVSDNGVSVVNATAISARAGKARVGVGARGDKLAVCRGAAHFDGKLTKGLTKLLA